MQNGVQACSIQCDITHSPTMLNVCLLEQMFTGRWMGNGLRCESRPFHLVEKALMESLCELSRKECLKPSPTTGTLEGLNYPESWSNLVMALVLQERNRENREWCSEALSMLLCCCTSRASAIVRICSSCSLKTKEKNKKPY